MSFKKYPDIERLGSEDNKDILAFETDTIVVEEKVDGGNFSMWIEENGLICFGSRNRNLTAENDKKTFEGYQTWLREHLLNLEKQGILLNQDYYYYLEVMQKHTISYTKAPKFIGIDIRMKHMANQEGFGFFLGRDTREQEFTRLKIENVPLVWRGTVKEIKKMDINQMITKSAYYEGKAEGVVLKNYVRKHPHENHQLYAKIVTDEFKENNKAVFGGLKQKNSDTSKIIEQYCTEARIKKAVLKFVNEEGLPLDRKLMAKVPTHVTKDILKEEFKEIYDNYSFVDFKEMKQKIPRLCLKVIDEMMTIKAIGEKE